MPRIRPVLALLSARAAASGEPDSDTDSAAEHVAAAAELLHLAILLHDAALGRQGGRRRRAARRLLSGAVGVLAGNHLTLRALELTRRTPTPEIVGDLLDAMREVSEGHALAQSLAGRIPTVAEALALGEHRSGAVFSFACRAGARLAGAPRKVVTALGRYGRHTGAALHLAEDLASLDEAEDGGEPSGNSLEDRAAEGRPGYSLSLAAERDPGIAELWAGMGRDPDPDQVRKLARRIRATGAATDARKRLALECWAARQALQALRPSRHRDVLDQIAATLAWDSRGEEPQPLGQP